MAGYNFTQDERSYLEQERKKFILEFPQLSNFLEQDCIDPDINRTLDGLSYLTSLLDTKLEQEQVHLTFSLMDMLWTNYLQPIPSIVMMKFSNELNTSLLVKKGIKVYSKSYANLKDCLFQTARDIKVSPFEIVSIKKIGGNKLEFNFQAKSDVWLVANELNKLRLFCGFDEYCGSLIYLWLKEHLQQANLVINNSEYELPNLNFVASVLANKESVLMYPSNVFSGYRLLHEYFCYLEGFLFLEIEGVPDYFSNIKTSEFSLRVEFKSNLPASLKIDNNLLKTNCCPAINLFTYDLEPICLDGRKIEYPLSINYKDNEHYELFAIEKVTGVLDKQTREYSSFANFHHEIERDKGGDALYYYLNRKQDNFGDKINYAISFVRSDEVSCYGKDEIISIRAWCSNNNDAQNLRLNSICVANDDIDAAITLTNLTYPSKVIRPKLNNNQQWAIISLLSLNYLTLLQQTSLKQILQNYNFAANYSDRATQKLSNIIKNITKFETKWHRTPYQDLAIEGHKSTVEIASSAFKNDGQMYLFGEVLAYFYAECANVNSFHFLELVNTSNKEVYSWNLMNS